MTRLSAQVPIAEPLPLLATMALCLSSCSRPDTGAIPGAGALSCAAPVRDFGTVYEGQVLEHEFEVRVLAPTRIDAPRTDCGCTVARLEVAGGSGRRALEPGPSGSALPGGVTLHVAARFDTRGRPGLAQRSVTLTGADPRPLALQLVAEVQEFLVAEPRQLEYVRLLEGQEAERRLRVRSADGRPFALRATGLAIPPAVHVELDPLDPVDPRAGTGPVRSPAWEVRVRLGPDTPRGSHTYPIELESDLPVPGVPGRLFSVAPSWSLQVVGPVALSSPSLDFGLVRPDEVVSRSVRLECFEPGFRLQAPQARLEPVPWGPAAPGGFALGRTAAVHARVAPDGRSCDFELTLDGLDPAVVGTFLAQLVVETGHPGLGQLTAVVRGTRSPGPAPAGAGPRSPGKERP